MAHEPAGSLLQRHLLLGAALCDPRTSKGDCQVLAVISAHAKNESGEAYPGVNRIAKRAGIHRSTVLASVARLQGWGYVDVHRERGRSNVYRLATGSANTTSQEGELVAPTLPPREVHQSRPRDGGGSADATGLVAPTRPDQSRPRYPNSAFDLSSSTQKKNSVACGAFSEEERQQREQERLAEEVETEKRLCTRARELYLDAKSKGDTAVMEMVLKNHRHRVADLIENPETFDEWIAKPAQEDAA
jgi:hypothetical protein